MGCCTRQQCQQHPLATTAVQVGSKNAAFFMGRCIKLSTKRSESDYVHELRIAAAELEQRYKNSEVRVQPAATPGGAMASCSICC